MSSSAVLGRFAFTLYTRDLDEQDYMCVSMFDFHSRSQGRNAVFFLCIQTTDHLLCVGDKDALHLLVAHHLDFLAKDVLGHLAIN